MYQLESITAQNLPAIPLIYGASWYEYSNRYFTGWPTASNPYAAPQPYTGPAQAIVITHLTPRK
jgi:peptide/nickel transport system substrate-binding protein